MKMIVNGKPLDHPGPGALLEVLRQLGAAPEHVAVMVNDAIVRRADFDTRRLCEGDRVDVLTLARGG